MNGLPVHLKIQLGPSRPVLIDRTKTKANSLKSQRQGILLVDPEICSLTANVLMRRFDPPRILARRTEEPNTNHHQNSEDFSAISKSNFFV